VVVKADLSIRLESIHLVATGVRYRGIDMVARKAEANTGNAYDKFGSAMFTVQ